MKAVAAAEHSAAQLEAQAQSVRDKEQTKARVAALREALGLGPLGAGAARGSDPPPPLRTTPRPSPRTNRTRRVPHPVLIGPVASFTPY
jgi:hypothetical protein